MAKKRMGGKNASAGGSSIKRGLEAISGVSNVKKGSYEIATRSDHGIESKEQEGYLFTYNGESYGVIKKSGGFIVTDLKTGMIVPTSWEKSKNITTAIENITNGKMDEIRQTTTYQNAIKKFEKAKSKK